MSFTPEPRQTLFLWNLLAHDGGQFLNDVKPELKAKDRRPLEAAGLLKVEKRKKPNAKGKQGISYVLLSEQGWDWAARHLDAEISPQSRPGPILQAMLTKLKVFLERNRIALADFICCPPQQGFEDHGDLSQRIREAYCRASAGRWNVRVRLAHLREILPGVPREKLDAAILAQESAGSLVLYPLDDPQEIRPEDEAAAIPNSLGSCRHIMYIER